MTVATSNTSTTGAVFAAIPSTRTQFRPAAVPLVTCDPFFCIWSAADELTAKATSHWTGKSHRLTSLVRIDGQAFRLMGDEPADVPAATQLAVEVRPTQTLYTFAAGGVTVTLRFTSPMLADDLEILSRPASYLTWSAVTTDGKAHDVSIYFDAASEIAVNTPDQAVVASRFAAENLVALRVGSKEQSMLVSSGDDQRIDWGHLYVAAPASDAKAAIADASAARSAFAAGKPLPADAAETPAPAADSAVLTFSIPLGRVGVEAVSRHLTLAYDDEFSIKYFSQNLRPYWRRNGATAVDLLQSAERDYRSLLERCDAFDAELIADLQAIGGESYVQLGALAWRQALAAQKLCADANGQPLSFSKENFSNGCIATVDVLYPASPQMLIFAPSLLKASLVPILDYSASPRWTHDSAPHDLGQYPLAVAQAYGGEACSPMPVEESGNLLILVAALAKTEGHAEFAARYWPTLTSWYRYLKEHGLDPEHQLCTDDFAGHIARNANLSVKAILGIAGYGLLAGMLDKKAEADEALATARDFAAQWMKLGDEGDHYPLVFGDAGKATWSQKYNLVWDRLLDLNIFPADIARKELAFYKGKMNRYGLPLDSRKSYTKLDWELWTATLAENDTDFRQIVDACAKWAHEAPDRVPLSDWYDTKTGKQSGFQARSVVGGLFIGLMRDPSIWKKYAARDTLKPANWAELPLQPPTTRPLVATADAEPATWRYTSETPAENWMSPTFDDNAWTSGPSGFGVRGTPGAVVGTEWDSPHLYLRRTFELPAGELRDPHLSVHHDEDVSIYINGILAARTKGFGTRYATRRISRAARDSLRPGTNTLAVHCRKPSTGQYIDVGLVDVLPTPDH